MNLGLLFLESISTGITTTGEITWIATHLSDFSRTELSKAIQLGRLIDSGQVRIGSRIYKRKLLENLI